MNENMEKAKPSADSSRQQLPYNYGSYFRKKRKSRKVTADAAAKDIGCGSRTLRRLEANYDVSLKFSTFLKMASYYGFKLSILGNEGRRFDRYRNGGFDDSETQMAIIKAIGRMPYKEFTIISEMADRLANTKRSKPIKPEAKVAAIRNITSLNHFQLLLLQSVMEFMEENPECKDSSEQF